MFCCIVHVYIMLMCTSVELVMVYCIIFEFGQREGDIVLVGFIPVHINILVSCFRGKAAENKKEKTPEQIAAAEEAERKREEEEAKLAEENVIIYLIILLL